MSEFVQPSMFEMTRESAMTSHVSPPNPRQAVIDATAAKARAEWRERYEDFVLEFAQAATGPFTAEDVRERYLKTPGVPTTDHEQASGGIFQRLAKQGKLRKSDMKRSRKFGNLLQAYVKG